MTERKKKPAGNFGKIRTKPYRDRSFLHDHYLVRMHTAQDIAHYCGVSQNTILNWLHYHKLPVRNAGWAGHVK